MSIVLQASKIKTSNKTHILFKIIAASFCFSLLVKTNINH